jgi:hypothetical protein
MAKNKQKVRSSSSSSEKSESSSNSSSINARDLTKERDLRRKKIEQEIEDIK